MRRPYHQGLPTGHFDGVRFFNPGQPSTDRSLAELLRWRLNGSHTKWLPAPSATPAVPQARVEGLCVTMIGHASVLVQVAGLNLLVDPVWSQRASPFGFVGPKRWDAPGIAFDDLPPIDAVLVTHNHYDHLDAATLRRLAAVHRPLIVAPLGNGGLIAGMAGGCQVIERDWGGAVALRPDITATLHPANHWSARGMRDRRMALWCGFVLQAPGRTVYLAGDTAYGDGSVFRAVQDGFGAPDLAILPIGAYEPRWFMRNQHANPEDAVRILLACGARQALGVHWGTFRLTDEARFAPPAALAEACERHGVAAGRFIPMRPGQVWAG